MDSPNSQRFTRQGKDRISAEISLLPHGEVGMAWAVAVWPLLGRDTPVSSMLADLGVNGSFASCAALNIVVLIMTSGLGRAGLHPWRSDGNTGTTSSPRHCSSEIFYR